jgi:hypothetical protein
MGKKKAIHTNHIQIYAWGWGGKGHKETIHNSQMEKKKAIHTNHIKIYALGGGGG